MQRPDIGEIIETDGEIISALTHLAERYILRDFPLDARDVLKQAKGGKLKLGFRVTGLEPLRHTLDNISYRLVFGLVGYGIAAIISVGFLVAIAIQAFRR